MRGRVRSAVPVETLPDDGLESRDGDAETLPGADVGDFGVGEGDLGGLELDDRRVADLVSLLLDAQVLAG